MEMQNLSLARLPASQPHAFYAAREAHRIERLYALSMSSVDERTALADRACDLFDVALAAPAASLEDAIAQAAIWADRLEPELAGLRDAIIALLRLSDRSDVLYAIGRSHLLLDVGGR